MKNLTIHLVWVIAILIAIISALLWRLPNGSSLSGYISFAASIASLVLAAVAIFQSVMANDSFGKAIFQIQNSAEKIVEETSRLGVASLTLGEEAESALKRLSELPDQIQNLKGEISEKFEKIVPQNATLNEKWSCADEIIGGKTYAFAISIYLMAVSFLSRKHIILDDLFKEGEYKYIRDYSSGVIATMKNFDVLGVKIESVGDRFNIKSMGSINANLIVDHIRSSLFPKGIVHRTICMINGAYDQEWIPDEISSSEGSKTED